MSVVYDFFILSPSMMRRLISNVNQRILCARKEVKIQTLEFLWVQVMGFCPKKSVKQPTNQNIGLKTSFLIN